MSTPRRSLAKPRPSHLKTNAVSTPNLNAAYSQLQNPVLSGLLRAANGGLVKKPSLNALTSGSLATIPDESEGYALSAVLDLGSSPHEMSRRPSTADGGGNDQDVEVGDLVDVPGNMYGTVKFVGSVYGKKGIFAGVELGEEFADKGKNNGDVEGRTYFRTNNPGAGIFLPIARAIKRTSPLRTPTNSGFGNSRLGASHSGFTPPTPSLPKFSQSVGPGRAPSPQRLQRTRPSIPRPESPIRRPQTAGPGANLRRPSMGGPQSKTRFAPSPTPPNPNKFAQSVRGTQDSRDPMKKFGLSARASPTKGSYRSASALGQQYSNYSDDELTPIGMARTTNNDSLGSMSSFNAKLSSSKVHEEELERLRTQLEQRDQQLKEQASSLAEMESSLNEVQSLMGGSENGNMRQHRNSADDKDAAQLRSELREKKEKIAMLTAEFDAHRADFRSTIDTLELASTETERVYEQKVQDLLNEIRDYQDRSEDVDSVARQLKQLEELVQELEEGLEDARRGEAEARGEVEFLRGEVERGRSELKRERDKSAALSNGDNNNLAKEVMQRDDEIRGLKAIIHSLSRDGIPDSNMEPQRTPTQIRGRPSFETADDRLKLEREIDELKSTLENKSHREEELERELEQLRIGSASLPPPSQRTSASNGTLVPEQTTPRDSKGTIGSWRAQAPEAHKRANTLETMPESDTHSSATDGTEGTLWCQMCETGGHDILNCTNMFGNQDVPAPSSNRHLAPIQNSSQVNTYADTGHEDFKPAPLSPMKKAPDLPPAPRILPNPMEPGPVAGKESGIVDENKWCALCERDGHESVDCPFEDAF